MDSINNLSFKSLLDLGVLVFSSTLGRLWFGWNGECCESRSFGFGFVNNVNLCGCSTRCSRLTGSSWRYGKIPSRRRRYRKITS